MHCSPKLANKELIVVFFILYGTRLHLRKWSLFWSSNTFVINCDIWLVVFEKITNVMEERWNRQRELFLSEEEQNRKVNRGCRLIASFLLMPNPTSPPRTDSLFYPSVSVYSFLQDASQIVIPPLFSPSMPNPLFLPAHCLRSPPLSSWTPTACTQVSLLPNASFHYSNLTTLDNDRVKSLTKLSTITTH